jgi:hypothetical protein
MSGGGIIIEKQRVDTAVRYRVVDWKAARDEYIMALPADIEPQPGETMWWSADWIYFGRNDAGRLTRVGPCWDATA